MAEDLQALLVTAESQKEQEILEALYINCQDDLYHMYKSKADAPKTLLNVHLADAARKVPALSQIFQNALYGKYVDEPDPVHTAELMEFIDSLQNS